MERNIIKAINYKLKEDIKLEDLNKYGFKYDELFDTYYKPLKSLFYGKWLEINKEREVWLFKTNRITGKSYYCNPRKYIKNYDIFEMIYQDLIYDEFEIELNCKSKE